MIAIEHRVIVLPYRFGDCCNALPIAKKWADSGIKVSWVVHEQFLNLFEGIGYVTAVPFVGRMNDIKTASEVAKSYLMELGVEGRIYPLKSGNFSPAMRRPTEHFTAELWERAGELAHYHTLPVVFDKRNKEREDRLVQQVVPSNDSTIDTPIGPLHCQQDKGLLVYCFRGHSYKYGGSAQLEEWLVETNRKRGEPWRLLNLANVGAYRLYDMLAILEKASCMLSIDTSFVHLARAAQLPTVVIVQERNYDSPEPQRHWIGSLRGSVSNTSASHASLERWLFDLTDEQRRKRMGHMCRQAAAMYAKPIMFGLAAVGSDAPIAAQAAARQSHREAALRDRFWIESDVMLPVEQLGLEKTIGLLLEISPKISQDCIVKYLALARPGMCLTNDSSHLLRCPLLDQIGCAWSGHIHTHAQSAAVSINGTSSTELMAITDSHYSERGVDNRDGVLVLSIDWWLRQYHTLPQPLNWTSLWNHVRHVGLHIERPSAYHEHQHLIH